MNHVDVGTLHWLVHVAVLLVVESQRSLEKRRRPQKKRGVLKAKRNKNPSGVVVVVMVDVAITVALTTYLADVADVVDVADVADVAVVEDVEVVADVADVAVTVDGVVMETGTVISDMVTGLEVAVAVDGDMGTTEDVEDVEVFVMEDVEDMDMDAGDAVDVVDVVVAVVAVDVAVAESSDLSWLKTAKNNQKSNPKIALRQPKKTNLPQRPIKRTKRQANDGDYGGVVEDVAGWVTWVEDHGVVVEDLVIGTGVDVAPLEVGVAVAVTVVVEVMEVVEAVEAVEVMVAVASEVAASELLALEVDPHPLEVDPGHFSMKGAANLTWVLKVLLTMLMMKSCPRKRLRHCQ